MMENGKKQMNKVLDGIRTALSDLPNSYKISELDSLPEITANDLMLVSNPLQQNVYRSYRMEYHVLSNDVKTTVSCLPDTSFTGAWTILGRMTLPTKRIDEEDDNAVVNCDWLSTHFIRELTKLSNEIYEKDHIQSYVGEVIYSTTLRTEEQVRKRYGAYTSWDRVEGRFIMSTTSNAMVEKTTGDYETKLSIRDTPTHSHGISFENNVKTYRLNWSIPLNPATICNAKEQSRGEDIKGGNGDAWTMLDLNRDIKEDMLWTNASEEARACNWADGRVAVAYGHGKSHGEGGAWILANRGENKAHNNIPPFYTVHVWKRVK